MLKQQNDCCKICKKHKSLFKTHLHVDHDHSTGKIRGLLCQKCNQGIGYFYESIASLQNAIKYLSGEVDGAVSASRVQRDDI